MHNYALQRTHSPVTPLAEERKRRARRRAAERGRSADKMELGEGKTARCQSEERP